MKVVKITPDVAVSEQIVPEDVAAIAAAGFKVLINNRPDGEAPGLAGAFASARGPALAFCRSGTRSINLWLATRPEAEWPEAVRLARSLGYDLSMVGQR